MFSLTFIGLYSFTFTIEILVQRGAVFIQCFLHLPKVNRKTRGENSQQILVNIGYGLGVTP